MAILAAKVVIGFLVGTLIGLTGVGGGVLLLPVLIFGLRVPPIVAVGSDALFNFFTKIPAGLMHLRKGTVRRKVVIALATGSVPGSIAGVSFLTHLRHVYGDGVNDFIKTAIGVLLIIIPTLLLLQRRIEERVANRRPTMKSFVGMSFIGLVAGFLVGMTSVGSGSIIMMLLLLFYSFPPKVNVGTDIVHVKSLTARGWSGWSVGQALQGVAGSGVVITFDDGCETDLLMAGPLLHEHGMGATFYVTTGFVGKKGYLTVQQLRELHGRPGL